MIRKENFEQAVPLAQKLADKGVELGVVGGSPLHDLLEHSSVAGLHANGGSFEDVSLDSAIAHLCTQANYARADGQIEHSIAMQQNVELAVQAVKSSLDTARNVVVPEINRIHEKIDQVIRGVVASRRDPYVIVPSTEPKLLKSPWMYEVVERFAQTTAAQVPAKRLVELSAEDVRALLKTGATGFDDDMDEILSGNDTAWYVDVLVDFLAGKVDLEAVPDHAQALLFILARALYDNPQEGTQVSLVDYNTHLSQVIAQTGRRTVAVIESLNNARRLKRLYIGEPARPAGHTKLQGAIYVNAEVYADLLEEGLSPEMLFGNEYLGRRYLPSDLIAQKDELLKVYERERAYVERQAKLEEFNIIKESIERVMLDEIADRSEEQLVTDRGTYRRVLAKAMERVTPGHLHHLSALVRDIVCDVFYRHLDVVNYLRLIDEIGKDLDGTVDVREVALMATIEYVSMWVAQQITKQ